MLTFQKLSLAPSKIKLIATQKKPLLKSNETNYIIYIIYCYILSRNMRSASNL